MASESVMPHTDKEKKQKDYGFTYVDNVKYVLGPTGPQGVYGPVGPTGPMGPNEIYWEYWN